MNIIVTSSDEFFVKSIKETVKFLFAEVKLFDTEPEPNEELFVLEIVPIDITTKSIIKFSISTYSKINNEKVLLLENILEEDIYNHGEKHNQIKRMAKLGVYQLLNQYLKKPLAPWGILTGIRPTKIVHRLIDQGFKKDNIIKHLINFYALKEEKANLLTDVAIRQRQYLHDEIGAAKFVSIYIGIPFCPTRCAYCSFPAYSLKQWGKQVDPYLAALHLEIRKIGEMLKELSLEVETIYIGGGTPTSLSPQQLEELIQHINHELVSFQTKEFTVEAGRPDTISVEILKVLKEGGVNRVSINPQSMQEKTLVAIGRKHSPRDIYEKVKLAREMGFNNINMDIIIGLPGEKAEDVQLTMNEIKEISPENITVHTMAIKRASKLKEEIDNYSLPVDMEVSKMFNITQGAISEMNMHPYYLYRQKQILGQLENIGFAKEGFDCLYNIQMMEERQTVIGLGVGSGSKFVQPGEWTLESIYNPKDLLIYIERINDIIMRKNEMLLNIFDKERS